MSPRWLVKRVRTRLPDERRQPGTRAHRRDSIGVQVRYAVAILTALIAAFAATQAYMTARELRANVQNQVRNRTANVDVWCRSINLGRDYDRAFVLRVTHGHVKYALGDLDCRAIERATLASTKK